MDGNLYWFFALYTIRDALKSIVFILSETSVREQVNFRLFWVCILLQSSMSLAMCWFGCYWPAEGHGLLYRCFWTIIIIWKWAFVCTCLHAVETETVLLWQITQRHQGASVKLGTGQPSQAMIYLLLLCVCTCSKLQTDWRLCGNQMRKLYDLIE